MKAKARVYVSTYGKYNSGKLIGEWVELDEFSSVSEFVKYCCGIFIDENNPELMFQEWEGVPDFLCYESMSERELERLFEFLSLDEYMKGIVVAYVDATGNSEEDFSHMIDLYCGSASSEAEFAEEYVRETMSDLLDKLPSFIVIDWEETWRQNLQHDFYTGKDESGEEIYFFYQR